ncbi:MAG: hypothetical protein JNK65_07795, partial [Deltaproteobacteria bacterium]|nr:hypothetical protein [Deltaproteobacteria bacterium]
QNLFFEDAIPWRYIKDSSTQDQVMELRGSRLGIVGLSTQPLVLEDIKEVIHPVLFLLHDAVIHIPLDHFNPKEYPPIARELYFDMKCLIPDSSYRQKALNELSDLRMPGGNSEDALGEILSAQVPDLKPGEKPDPTLVSYLEHVLMLPQITGRGSTLGRVSEAHIQKLRDKLSRLMSLSSESAAALPSTSSKSVPRAWDRPLVYTPEMEEVWNRIHAVIEAPDHIEGDLQSLRRKAPHSEDVDRLWFYQLEDLFSQIPHQEIRWTTLEEISADLPEGERAEQVRHLIAQKDSENSYTNRVLELRVRTGDIPMGLENNAPLLDFIFHPSDLTSIQRLGGFLAKEIEGNIEIYRYTSLSFFEKFNLEVLRSPIQPHYVNGEISQEDVMCLRGRRVGIIGLSKDLIYLGDVDALVHPVIFIIHDFYAHVMNDRLTPVHLLPMASELFFEAKKFLPHSAYRQKLLDSLSDLRLNINLEGDTQRVFHKNVLGPIERSLEDGMFDSDMVVYLEALKKMPHFTQEQPTLFVFSDETKARIQELITQIQGHTP